MPPVGEGWASGTQGYARKFPGALKIVTLHSYTCFESHSVYRTEANTSPRSPWLPDIKHSRGRCRPTLPSAWYITLTKVRQVTRWICAGLVYLGRTNELPQSHLIRQSHVIRTIMIRLRVSLSQYMLTLYTCPRVTDRSIDSEGCTQCQVGSLRHLHILSISRSIQSINSISEVSILLNQLTIIWYIHWKHAITKSTHPV